MKKEMTYIVMTSKEYEAFINKYEAIVNSPESTEAEIAEVEAILEQIAIEG